MHWLAGLVLLLCWGSTSSQTHLDIPEDKPKQRHSPPGQSLDFGFVPSKVYETHAYYEPGAIGFLFQMVHAFLYVVQPNPFPEDMIKSTILQNKGGLKIEELNKPENVVLILQAAYYEVGFIVCLCLGVVFVLVLPLVGMCFCVCRCCENCGGEMHQRQRKNVDCRRAFFTAALALTTIVIAAGVLVAFAANENISSQIMNTRSLIYSNLKDLRSFANNTPSQVEYLASQYTTAKNKVLSDLENIGPVLGGRIKSQLEKEVVPTLDSALRMANVKVDSTIKALRETNDALENMSSSLELLQEGSGRLAAGLAAERSSLANTLSDRSCGDGATANVCNSIRSTLTQLAANADFSLLPDVHDQLDNMDAVMNTDLTSIVQRGYSSFNNTPRLVKEQTTDVVAALPRVKAQLDRIGEQVTGFTKSFPVKASLDNFTLFLGIQQREIESYYPQIDQFDFYRWIGCVSALCVLVLILAFNVLGLLCGTCGYDQQATPTTRGCVSNTGGNMLMAGVGFTFIFAWVLMAIVGALFVVGGNIEKLVCEPMADRQLFKIIDTPFMVHPQKKNFLPGMLFQKPDVDLTVGSMYRDCYENNGLYKALQLEKLFNVNSFLNKTVLSEDLAGVFGSVHIDLQGSLLLEQADRDKLIEFANTGVGTINYAAYMAEVGKGATLVDLLSYSNVLESQADQLSRGALKNALKGHASTIRQIHREQVVPMEQEMKYVRARSTLSSSIRLLQRTASDLPMKVTNVLGAIDAAEYLMTHNASHVVKQETDAFMDGLVGYFRQYTAWVAHSLTTEVAPCKPISNLVDSLEIVACSYIVDSVNTFWFGLGGSCLFLIPSIILSVKLAKFYRRMDTEDVFDDGTETWN